MASNGDSHGGETDEEELEFGELEVEETDGSDAEEEGTYDDSDSEDDVDYFLPEDPEAMELEDPDPNAPPAVRAEIMRIRREGAMREIEAAVRRRALARSLRRAQRLEVVDEEGDEVEETDGSDAEEEGAYDYSVSEDDVDYFLPEDPEAMELEDPVPNAPPAVREEIMRIRREGAMWEIEAAVRGRPLPRSLRRAQRLEVVDEEGDEVEETNGSDAEEEGTYDDSDSEDDVDYFLPEDPEAMELEDPDPNAPPAVREEIMRVRREGAMREIEAAVRRRALGRSLRRAQRLEVVDEEADEVEILEIPPKVGGGGEGRVESGECETDVSPASCPICLDLWSQEGAHRVCCTPCGHVYGRSCLERWLQQCGKQSAKCPQCNRKFGKGEIINLFAPQVIVNYDLEKEVSDLQAKNESLISERKKLLEQVRKYKKREIYTENVARQKKACLHQVSPGEMQTMSFDYYDSGQIPQAQISAVPHAEDLVTPDSSPEAAPSQDSPLAQYYGTVNLRFHYSQLEKIRRDMCDLRHDFDDLRQSFYRFQWRFGLDGSGGASGGGGGDEQIDATVADL